MEPPSPATTPSAAMTVHMNWREDVACRDADPDLTQQSAENMAYVRRLLGQKQPGFSAALELALMLTVLELTSPGMSGQLSPSEGS